MRAAAAGDGSAYLTADAPPPGPGGAPAPLGPLALALARRRDFAVVPPLAGGLVLAALHVWIGAATVPTSSGLHHDYHDNLYCVAAGEKTFTVFPPAAARGMATAGRVAAIHPTGRIVYEGQGAIAADGSDAGIRRAAAALEAGPSAGAAPDDDDDDALDAALAAAAAGESVVDDFDDESESDGSDGGAAAPPSDPPSFSTLDPATDAARLPMHRAATVTLRSGDTLFLPAGWFHSVASKSGVAGADARLHAAVSWWFHPPDAVERPDAPYAGTHWRALWRAAVAACPALADAVDAGGGGSRPAPAPARKPAKRARGEE